MRSLSREKHNEIQALLKRHAYASDAIAALIFVFDIAAFIAAEVFALTGGTSSTRMIGSIAAGLMLGMLFIVAHDACHLTFFTKKAWNHILGRIAFLPTFHSYSLWENEHNWRHHAFTNISGADRAYAPMPAHEFSKLGTLKRARYRFFRSLIGIPFYYLFDVHLPCLVVPRKARLKKFKAVHWTDCALVIAAMILFPALCVLLRASHVSPLEALFAGFLLPQFIWNILVTVVTYQQHTHPSIPWFSATDNWDFSTAQTQCTTDISLTEPGDIVFHNVYRHPAHHLQSRIPLYRLAKAQNELKAALEVEDTVNFFWGVPSLLKTIRVCKLYDFQTHCWTDYDGNVTARIPARRTPVSRGGPSKRAG